MLYLNQLDYPHIPYNHNMAHGGVPEERRCVATSGCGMCSLCMIVGNMTMGSLPLEECVKLTEDLGANMELGSKLTITGPAVAERFGLTYSSTNDVNVLIDHLRRGGKAVANVGGDREGGYIGLFSHVGHYIVVDSIDGNEVCILDPSYKEGKFDEEGRQGKVKVCYPYIYCDVELLAKDAANRDPGFHLFMRKK